MDMNDLMMQARQTGASDLILVAGKPPCLYVHGQLQPLGKQVLEPQSLDRLLLDFMSDEQKAQLARMGDSDFACGSPTVGRVRVNVHRQRGSLAAAVRFVNTEIPSMDTLRLPDRLIELARLPRGLVLVTGATGSGKSTTLAAMIEYMNENLERHIITLEDPIEFIFNHRRCVIEQREIGEDTPDFASALRHVVRQKPEVILVGEMRDRETIATALTASETGHLVLGTLHTNTAAHTIERIIDMFEAGQQAQIRIQLANTLQAVVCQSLLPRQDGPGMVPAVELLLMTPAIRRAIRDSETHLIPGMIETGGKLGMCAMDRALATLVGNRVVSAETALNRAVDPEKLGRLIGTIRGAAGGTTVLSPASTDEVIESRPLATAGRSSKPWH